MGEVLPKNWVEVQLMELLKDLQTGVRPKGGVQGILEGIPSLGGEHLNSDGGFNFKNIKYVPSNFAKGLKRGRIKNNDILIVKDGATTGKTSFINNDFPFDEAFVNEHVFICRAFEILNAKYLFYFLRSKKGQNRIMSNFAGAAQGGINTKFASNTLVSLAPLAEQERILAKLDKLFAQIGVMKKALERIPRLLKNFRQQVLTLTVTGKLTEEWRMGKIFENFSLNSIKDSLKSENAILNAENIQANRSKHKINPFKFLRENNFGWSFFTLESLCVAIVDCLHETARFSEIGFKIIDTNNIEAFRVNEAKLRYVDSRIYTKWISRLKPKYGDVVFTREGTIGNALMITENDSYCIGQRTMIFRFSKLLNSRFSELYLNSEPLKNQYRHLIKGVASQHLNIKDIRLLEIPLPSLEEQKQIVNRIESLFAKADKIEEKYKLLKAKIEGLPHTILHKAFKGELVEQLPTDGDAKDLMEEIKKLKIKK